MNYEKIYNQIINSGKNRIIIGYSEKHHIIPKCNGGDNSKENLVSLTAKEHFICHKLLCEIYPENNKLKYAYWLMCNVKNKYQERNYKVSSREYSELKLKLGIIRSKETNNRLGIKHTTESINKIKIARAKQVFSDETKKKLSDLRKGKIGNKNFKHTEESKKKMSNKLKGTRLGPRSKNYQSWNKGLTGHLSEEVRKKMSESRLKTPKMTCFRCQKQITPHILSRYHGDKCKLSGSQDLIS